jgi:methionyl-tRNA formyltransferase
MPLPLRIVFMGTPEFAVPTLEAMLATPELCEVVAVVTQPDRPAGRGRQVQHAAVKACALKAQLPVFQPTRMRTPETHAYLKACAADVFVVAAYGRILPLSLLELPRHGCINVHASLLPKYRGASPIARAIWQGDDEAGVCIMGMEVGCDTGPVYDRAAVTIDTTTRCLPLTQELALLGAQRLLHVLEQVRAGTAQPVVQPTLGVTLAPPLHKEDGRLDFAQDAAGLVRQIHALDPWPGTYAFFGPDRVAVLDATALAQDTAHLPGTVVDVGAAGVVVACKTGCLQISAVKPAGRGPMQAQAWSAGRGPKKGAILTSHP